LIDNEEEREHNAKDGCNEGVKEADFDPGRKGGMVVVKGAGEDG